MNKDLNIFLEEVVIQETMNIVGNLFTGPYEKHVNLFRRCKDQAF